MEGGRQIRRPMWPPRQDRIIGWATGVDGDGAECILEVKPKELVDSKNKGKRKTRGFSLQVLVAWRCR